MPATTTKKTTTKKTETKKTSKPKVTEADYESKMKDLLALEAELKAKLAALSSIEETTTAVEPEAEEEVYVEINPNKKVRVYSMTFGLLTIHCAQRGFTEFPDFGSFKILNYGQLSDYMLTCAESFKAGNLYIADPMIVSNFGLDEYYENIFSMDLVNSILKGTAKDYAEKIANSTKEQKEALAKYIALLVYEEKFADYNVVKTISDACGIDINEKVSQMKEVVRNSQAEE